MNTLGYAIYLWRQNDLINNSRKRCNAHMRNNSHAWEIIHVHEI